MANLDIRWLAGFFDGEGSFAIQRHNTGHQVCIYVCNTNMAIMDLIEAQFPGNKRNTNANSKKFSNRKRCDVIWWRGETAIKLAARMLPHLQVKQGQARCVVDYPLWKASGPGITLPKSIYKKREQLLQIAKKLNKRGIK